MLKLAHSPVSYFYLVLLLYLADCQVNGNDAGGSGARYAAEEESDARSVAIPTANPSFEAAFQGECGKNNNSNPCEHICLDLHDGTYECSCFYGFALAVDGYSCAAVQLASAATSSSTTSSSSSSSSSTTPTTVERLPSGDDDDDDEEPGGLISVAQPEPKPSQLEQPQQRPERANDNRKLADELARGSESKGNEIGQVGRELASRPRRRRLHSVQDNNYNQQVSVDGYNNDNDNDNDGDDNNNYRDRLAGEANIVARRAEPQRRPQTSPLSTISTRRPNSDANKESAPDKWSASYDVLDSEQSDWNRDEIIELSDGANTEETQDVDGDEDDDDDDDDQDIRSIMRTNDRLVSSLEDSIRRSSSSSSSRGSDRPSADLQLLQLLVGKTLVGQQQQLTESHPNTQLAPSRAACPSDLPDHAHCAELPAECESGGRCAVERLPSGQQRARCRCPIGRGGLLCQKPVQRTTPRFAGHSYLALPMVAEPELRSLRLVFRSSSSSSVGGGGGLEEPDSQRKARLMLYSQRFVLLLDDMSRVELRFFSQLDAHSSPVTRVIGSRDVQPDTWTELIVTQDDNLLEPAQPHLPRVVLVTPQVVQLSSKVAATSATNIASTATTNSSNAAELFVGGLPEALQVVHSAPPGQLHLRHLHDRPQPEGFRGCISELRFNQRLYNFKSDLNGDALDGYDIDECCQ